MAIKVCDFLECANIDGNVMTIALIDNNDDWIYFSGTIDEAFKRFKHCGDVVMKRDVVEWNVPYGDEIEIRI